MEAAAKLIAAFGSLLGAIAWPSAILTLAAVFRKEIQSAFQRIPSFLDRVHKMKVAGIEAELERVADASQGRKGEVTPRQIETAARIAIDADEYLVDLFRQLDRLCLEYDALRRSLPSGANRTDAMTRIVTKMRALAPSLVSHIDTYKVSGSAGSRLAAVAMMQMNPNTADIQWLAERFEKEEPFIFYHAALALQNLANNALTGEEWDELLGAATRSLAQLKSFNGVPDHSTVEILDMLINSIS